MNECKRCLLNKIAEADTLKSIEDTISKLPESERTDKKTYNDNDKISIYQEKIIIINMKVPNNKTQKYLKKKCDKLKEIIQQ